jgi:hypothetical protein
MTGRHYWTNEAINLALEAGNLYGYGTPTERTQAIKKYPPLVDFFKKDVGIWDADEIGARIIQKLRQVHPNGDKNPERYGKTVKRRAVSKITPRALQSTPSFMTPLEASGEGTLRKSLQFSHSSPSKTVPAKISPKISHEISWPKHLKFERLTHG